jgi:hypothetical protein
MNKGAPGDPKEIFRAAVERGLQAGASYLEIYTRDALSPDFQDILSATQKGLAKRTSEPPSGGRT